MSITMAAKPLSVRLKEAREAAGLTQLELATASGVAVATVSQLEQGRMANPRLDTLRALAKALGVTLDELGGE